MISREGVVLLRLFAHGLPVANFIEVLDVHHDGVSGPPSFDQASGPLNIFNFLD